MTGPSRPAGPSRQPWRSSLSLDFRSPRARRRRPPPVGNADPSITPAPAPGNEPPPAPPTGPPTYPPPGQPGYPPPGQGYPPGYAPPGYGAPGYPPGYAPPRYVAARTDRADPQRRLPASAPRGRLHLDQRLRRKRRHRQDLREWPLVGRRGGRRGGAEPRALRQLLPHRRHEPEASSSDGSSTGTRPATPLVGGFGAGVVYYFMPVNIYLSGAVAAVNFQADDANGKTDLLV